MYLFCNFKYELITDDTRRSALSRFAGCRRAVFNKALELQNERKAKNEKLFSYVEMAHLSSGRCNVRFHLVSILNTVCEVYAPFFFRFVGSFSPVCSCRLL